MSVLTYLRSLLASTPSGGFTFGIVRWTLNLRACLGMRRERRARFEFSPMKTETRIPESPGMYRFERVCGDAHFRFADAARLRHSLQSLSSLGEPLNLLVWA